MNYKLTLYNLKNGMDKLESIVVDYKPSFDFCEQCCDLYGAEWFELEKVDVSID